MTTGSPAPFSANWYRFTGYELWGSYIRPKAGAALMPYDPWGLATADRKRSQGPYQELLSTYEKARGGPERWRMVGQDGAELILDWCNRHGLLGVLVHESVHAVVHPHWEPYGEAVVSEDLVVPRLRSFTRLAYGWQERIVGGLDNVRAATLHAVGEPVSEEDLPRGWPDSRVLRQPLEQDSLLETDIGSAWGKYFPQVPEAEAGNYDYPAPFTDRFWREYSEPVSEIVRGAGALHSFVEGLRRVSNRSGRTGEEEAWITDAEALQPRLLALVTPSVQVSEDGQLNLRWVCNSLLASLAMMAVEDLLGGRIPQQCPICGKYFVASSGQNAIYCSERCRQTAQKRAQRRRKKDDTAGVADVEEG